MCVRVCWCVGVNLRAVKIKAKYVPKSQENSDSSIIPVIPLSNYLICQSSSPILSGVSPLLNPSPPPHLFSSPPILLSSHRALRLLSVEWRTEERPAWLQYCLTRLLLNLLSYVIVIVISRLPLVSLN